MLFSEPIFLLFFSTYYILHVTVPRQWLYYILIVGSAFFYGYWNPVYLPLPFILTSFSYLMALKIEGFENQRTKKCALYFSVAALFLPLLFFKYTNFLTGKHIVSLALPLGISFVTFTLVAYVVDVYRGKFPAEKSILYLLGSVVYFPHLIAGPIVRPSQLIPQLKRWNPAVSGRFTYGLLIFSIGLFKKLVIADPIGAEVNQIYSALHVTTNAWDHLIAFYGFAVQIYCDFSGYTDMALGVSQALGIRLPGNFSRPYVSTSIVEFWTRWHITLSSWLRDYLYIPLGGNRKGFATQLRNIVITMGLGGLWHGANWTFVVWGLFHAIGISGQHCLKKLGLRFSLPKVVNLLVTFHFVSIGWVYFRARTLGDAHALLLGIFQKGWGELPPSYYFPMGLMLFFCGTHFLDQHRNWRFLHSKLPRLTVLFIILFLVSMSALLSHGNSADFIYFDF